LPNLASANVPLLVFYLVWFAGFAPGKHTITASSRSVQFAGFVIGKCSVTASSCSVRFAGFVIGKCIHSFTAGQVYFTLLLSDLSCLLSYGFILTFLYCPLVTKYFLSSYFLALLCARLLSVSNAILVGLDLLGLLSSTWGIRRHQVRAEPEAI